MSSSNICINVRCNKMISKKALLFNCNTCKLCRTADGTVIKRPKKCGYMYKNGTKCDETHLDYHDHCCNPTCNGNVLCELCMQCCICDPCIVYK